MNLLAIETATETVSVALSLNGEVRELYEHAPRKHAELLLPWVETLLAEGEIGFSALDGITYSRGPGSFTSLRIGIGIVQGLAWASDCPVIPVSSLAATAQSAAAIGVKSALVALDARMKEVFTASFELDHSGIMKPVDEERVCGPADISMPANPETHGIGIGFERYEALQMLGEQLVAVNTDVWPRASSVLELANDWLAGNQPLPAEQAQPVYLRNDVAKKSQQQG